MMAKYVDNDVTTAVVYTAFTWLIMIRDFKEDKLTAYFLCRITFLVL